MEKIKKYIKMIMFLIKIKFSSYEKNIYMLQNEPISEDLLKMFKYKYKKDYWEILTKNQKLSENFIKENINQFRSNYYFANISGYQSLSENFIKEFKDDELINWEYISRYQKLSENFIIEFKDYVNWFAICFFQELSEDFIIKFKDNLYLESVLKSQNLSEELFNELLEELKTKVEVSEEWINYIKNTRNEPSREEKIKDIKEYASEYNLEFDGEYLYAYRIHDMYGRGAYNYAIFYEKGKYYKDFHCDFNKEESCSFGLGIWPNGNIKVKVSVDDFGIRLCSNYEKKCRVKGFTIL